MTQPTKSIQTKLLKSGQRVYYSLTQKQSDSKISFNLRLLILVQEKYIGYISQKDINKKDIQNSIDLSKIKKKVYLKDIRRIINMTKDKCISITINDVDKDSKPISLKWVFKMDNLKLCQSWVQLLDKQNSPHPSRKTTQHKQEDKSPRQPIKSSSFVKQNDKKQNQNQKTIQKKIEDEQLQRKKKEQKLKQKQQELLKQKQRQKIIQIQKAKLQEKQRQKSKQIQRQRQRQQQRQRQRQLQGQNQRQKLIEKQRQEDRQRYTQMQNQKQKQKLLYQQQKQKYQQQKNQLSLKKAGNGNRQSDISFSFKGTKDNNIEQQDSYSPIKKQQQIKTPHPILQKIKTYQSNISSHLQQQVDLNLVSKQITQHKQQQKQKSKLKLKQKPVQFTQLSSNLTNRQKQLSASNFTNYFRQCIDQIDEKKYMDFYCFVQTKMSQLLSMNVMNEDKIQQKLNDIKQKNGVIIKILPSQLKQLPGNNNICDQSLIKSYSNKIKNQNYIWKIISEDQELSRFFLMPMSCMVQSQGVLAYFVCTFQPENINNQRSKSQDFFPYFQKLSDITMINRSILQNSNLIKFTKFSQDSFVISQINQFLPRLMNTNRLIRAQMFVQTMGNLNENERSYSIKVSKKQQDQQNRLFKNPIEKSIQMVSRSLDRLEEYFVHPCQFGQLIHNYGLNIINLNQIYKRVQNNFIKSIIKTQIALRSFKTIFRKKLQQIILQSNQNKSNSTSTIVKTLINILLSKPTQSSTELWKLVTLHSQINFKLSVERSEINKGYFLLGLQYYLGLKIETNYSSCEKIGTVEAFVQKVQFIVKIKMGELYWVEREIQGLQMSDAAKRLVTRLNLKQRQLPFYIYQDKKLSERIFQMISIYYSPNSPQIRNIPLYNDAASSSQYTLYYFHRKIAQVKWLIKSQSQSNPSNTTSPQFLTFIQKKLQQIKQPLLFYYPQYHPFYTQIYDLLISLHQYSASSSSLQKIQQLSKISMANMIQLCGGNTMHIKLTNNYYQKGQLYQRWGKIQQSFASYKKAKNILQVNQFTKSKQYAMVQLRLSQLYLNRGKDADAWNLLNGCYEVFCELIGVQSKQNSQYSNAQKLVSPQSLSQDQQLQIYNHITTCLSLMNRCYAPSKSSIILSHSLTTLQFFLQPSQKLHQLQLSDTTFIQLLKLLTQNYFIIHCNQITKQFFIYTQYICDQLHVSGSRLGDFNSANLYIKQLIINRVFIQVINAFSNKSKYQLDNKKQKKININMNINKKQDKKYQNFQKLIRAFVIVLGQGFILGMLNDQHI